MIDTSTLNQIDNYLKNHLSKKRYNHSLGVAEVSRNLAKVYDCDPEKAYFSGLVHDIAKEMSPEECQKYIKHYSIEYDLSFKKMPNIAHGEIGAIILQNKFSVYDETILDPVRWHTYGREKMTIMDKIVFIADAIEPNRHFKGVEILREIASKDLNEAILAYYDMWEAGSIKADQIIHKNTHKMIEYIKNEKNRL